MLWHVGKTTPLVVVFAGVCCGILLPRGDIYSLSFAVLFVLLLTDRTRIIHASIGIIIGFVSIILTPQWADISQGQHLIAGRVRDSGFYHGTFRVVLDNVSVDDEHLRGLAQLRIYRNVKELEKGCLIKVDAKIKHPRGYGNFEEFNYQDYLLARGITLAGSVKDFKTIEITESGYSYPVKDPVVSRLSALARPEAEVLKAVLTGDRSGLTYSLRDSFVSLGIAHLLAISGLHMGIIIVLGYTIVFTILRLIPPLSIRCDTPFIAKAGGLACAILFTVFVGSSIPTLRAVIMAGCLIGSLTMLRKANLLESLAVSGIIILSLWPASLYSASFLLSFSAVLGIVAVYSRIETFPGWLILLLIPIGATVFTLPVVMYLFGFVSPVGILSNLIIVPFFSFVIMPMGLTGLIFFPLSEFISSNLFSLCMDGIGFISKMSSLFGTLIPVVRPWFPWVLLCYTGLIVAFFARRSRVKSALLILSSILLFFIPVITQTLRISQPIRFNFISVGQGDSTLVTKGPCAMLIDAGGTFSGFDTGRFIVAPHLLRRGITHLDIVVITHTHPDHIGGIPFILDRFAVGEVWTNVKSDRSPYFQDVMRITQRRSIPLKVVSLGDIYELNGMKITVLNPERNIVSMSGPLDQNLHSIVLKVDEENMKGIFMADADGFGEIILCRLDNDLSADVLKVAHHGSRRSCTNMLLDRVRPEIAVISCGYENHYKVPSKDVIYRLEKRGVRVFRTDLDGEISACPGEMGAEVKSGSFRADNR